MAFDHIMYLCLYQLKRFHVSLLFYQIERQNWRGPIFLGSIFLGIRMNPKQKEFLTSSEGFLMAALTGHSPF